MQIVDERIILGLVLLPFLRRFSHKFVRSILLRRPANDISSKSTFTLHPIVALMLQFSSLLLVDHDKNVSNVTSITVSIYEILSRRKIKFIYLQHKYKNKRVFYILLVVDRQHHHCHN